jgi:hypothetical protein
MNLVAIADDLKNLSDGQLIQEINSPKGMAPSYLVLSELKRRKDLRSSYPTQSPTGTMAEQYTQGLMSAGPPNMQAAMNQSNMTGQPVAYGGGQVQGAQAPVQQFAAGGPVNGDFAGQMGLGSGFMSQQPPVARLASKALSMIPGQEDPLSKTGLGAIAAASEPKMQEQRDDMIGLLMGGDGGSSGAADAGAGDASGAADGSAYADGGEVLRDKQRRMLMRAAGMYADDNSMVDFPMGIAVPPERRSWLQGVRDRYQSAMDTPSRDLGTLSFGTVDNTTRFNPPLSEEAPPFISGDYEYPLTKRQIRRLDDADRIGLESPNYVPPNARQDTANRLPNAPMGIQSADVPPEVGPRDFGGLGSYYKTPNMDVTFPDQPTGIAASNVPDDLPSRGQGSASSAVVGGVASGGASRGGGGGGGGGGSGGGRTGSGTLAEFMEQVRGLQMPDRFGELASQNVAEKERLLNDLEGDKGMALLAAGLGIMGGQSPFAAVNIGQGAQAGIKQWNEDSRERRMALQALRQADQQIAIAQATRDERQLETGLKLKMAAEEALQRSADRAAASGDRAAARAEAAAEREAARRERDLDRSENRALREQQNVITEMGKYQTEIKGLDTIMVNPMLSDDQRKVLQSQREDAQRGLNDAAKRLRALRGEYDKRQPGRDVPAPQERGATPQLYGTYDPKTGKIIPR